ncbi:hypothetical protein DFH09DRAFT_1289984 [Mycena vulgaris]|nr:hypothetical protein DFH09DRAFT_1289984 [Mycena vulgaris]
MTQLPPNVPGRNVLFVPARRVGERERGEDWETRRGGAGQGREHAGVLGSVLEYVGGRCGRGRGRARPSGGRGRALSRACGRSWYTQGHMPKARGRRWSGGRSMAAATSGSTVEHWGARGSAPGSARRREWTEPVDTCRKRRARAEVMRESVGERRICAEVRREGTWLAGGGEQERRGRWWERRVRWWKQKSSALERRQARAPQANATLLGRLDAGSFSVRRRCEAPPLRPLFMIMLICDPDPCLSHLADAGEDARVARLPANVVMQVNASEYNAPSEALVGSGDEGTRVLMTAMGVICVDLRDSEAGPCRRWRMPNFVPKTERRVCPCSSSATISCPSVLEIHTRPFHDEERSANKRAASATTHLSMAYVGDGRDSSAPKSRGGRRIPRNAARADALGMGGDRARPSDGDRRLFAASACPDPRFVKTRPTAMVTQCEGKT